ncbi:hypothetical protein D1159_09125 [Pseudoflavonifractor sp. 524-17]|nr:hypothetical protein [Pseudoflavonifractor sp. 524-17]
MLQPADRQSAGAQSVCFFRIKSRIAAVRPFYHNRRNRFKTRQKGAGTLGGGTCKHRGKMI